MNLSGRDLENALKSQEDKKVWVVLQYTPDCPYCCYLAPVWEKMAEAYKGAEDRIQFAGVNCDVVTNCYQCDRYGDEAGVEFYPELLVFRKPKPDGTRESKAVSMVEIDKQGVPTDMPTAGSLCKWLEETAPEVLKPVNPVIEPERSTSIVFGVREVDGPPGPSGWDADDGRGERGFGKVRFHDAQRGLATLLRTGYRPAKHDDALKILDFVARCFPEDRAAVKLLNQHFLDNNGPFTEPEAYHKHLAGWEEEWVDKPANGDPGVCDDESFCAVWCLFHACTVRVAEMAGEGNVTNPPTSEQAMEFIILSVDKFLTCAACRAHFLARYEEGRYTKPDVLQASTEVERAKRLVLWLWRAHNAVSLKVTSEISQRMQKRERMEAFEKWKEGEEFPEAAPTVSTAYYDRRWPPFDSCKGCWNPEALKEKEEGRMWVDEGKEDDALVNATFKEDQIYLMLLDTYHCPRQ